MLFGGGARIPKACLRAAAQNLTSEPLLKCKCTVSCAIVPSCCNGLNRNCLFFYTKGGTRAAHDPCEKVERSR
eukprot:3841191-Amphidinium_carterae.1